MVQADATFSNPAGVERIGPSGTTLSATFHDADQPGAAAFNVSFWLRHPDDISITTLADDAADGQSGVSISDDGGGYYTATRVWDPPDAQETGFYDLYFSVREGVDTRFDFFHNNLDELQVYDAISNRAPSLVPGSTGAYPDSLNRNGSDFCMIRGAFADLDHPGKGSFTVTIRAREPGGQEHLIVDGALDGEQGLLIRGTGGPNYEASVIWDPPLSAGTGNYDLYFSVTDLHGAAIIDDYAANQGELTISASAILGDGHLLRRSNDENNCGGPNSACHNIADHEGQNCLACHTVHDSANIYLIRENIQTPNSGARDVVFKTLGIGDPYNDPDPVAGDPNSGVMADATDGVYTGICEVCHTSTNHHRNDSSTPPGDHHDAKVCTNCHLHGEGFQFVESSGGVACGGCHYDIYDPMKPGAGTHHHTMASDAPNDTPTEQTCLMCHVDHDIFRPDLNVGFGQRAKNLRMDIDIPAVPGDAGVLHDSDYSTAAAGGICMSCHSGNCSACHNVHAKTGDRTYEHNFLNKTRYDAATGTHNYDAASTFGSDGSTFRANCVKCHNDSGTKSYQNSTDKFGTHDSDYRKILTPLGIGVPGDPLEEEFCLECHDSARNPNSGSNLDYYGVQAMSNKALGIGTALGYASIHPVGATSGVHQQGENVAAMPRHVECVDCHDPHSATDFDPPSPQFNGVYIGTSGINIGGSVVADASYSYEVCFKCHGDNPGSTAYIPRLWPNLNTRSEFQPTSQSFHPIAAPGVNNDVPSLIGPWTESSIMLCEDCHGASTGSAEGLHGSEFTPLLLMKQALADSIQESASNYALCYSCHDRNSILNDESFGDHDKHINGEDASCTVCHDPHGVAAAGVGDGTHLINFKTNSVTPSSSGRLEFNDLGNFRGECYLTCHGKNHNPKDY